MIIQDEILLKLSYLESIEVKSLAKKAFDNGVLKNDFTTLNFNAPIFAKEEIYKLSQIINNARTLKVPSIVYSREDLNAVSLWDESYPSKLRELPDPPVILYYKGDIAVAEDNHHVAIVGTRKATGYGLKFTQLFSSMFSDKQIIIVSGLAYGIDAKAHESTLNKGRTIAVLGSGIDCIYPKRNQWLAKEILVQGGLIVSEYPPCLPTSPWHFPQRNRLISVLSDAVIVIEGDTQSGALITARFAIKQGRPVFALPGPLTSFMSNGPNALIKSKAATLITSVNDIYDAIGVNEKEKGISQRISDSCNVQLTQKQKHIIAYISAHSASFEELLLYTKLPFDELVQALSFLELNNLVIQSIDGGYVKT